ncbi:DUF4139 domain-containing protein, partial [bacterium]|nr:DUF4139 domain-containing protein [bacterium]
MRTIGSLLLVLIFLTTSVIANDIAVTIYNQNLGLVRDTRAVQIHKGAFSLEFSDVAAQIDPTSVHLKLDGATLLDQDFEYDLVSRERLLEKYLDQDVQIFTDQGEMFEGKLLSASGSVMILQSPDGQVQAVSPDAVRDVRFGELPGGLRTRPTLVWSLIGQKAGKKDAEISYLTGGLNWHAEYVAVINDKDETLELSSWVSIDNRSGTTYENAKLKLMAGDVQVLGPRGRGPVAFSPSVVNEAQDAKGFEEKAFFEYHLYTLQRPTTLKDRQTKQISLFDPAVVDAEREYVFEARRNATKVNVKVIFKNEEKAGLGLPLPAGKVRVYQADSDGGMEFIGEDFVDHTPKDEEVQLTVGSAFDIVAEKKTVEVKRISDRIREESYQIDIRNHKEEAVTVKVVEAVWGDWQM